MPSPKPPPMPPSPKQTRKPKTNAVKYRDRDAHEAFFRRPGHQQIRQRKRKPIKPPKTPPLTNKQRQQFARDYYQLNFGKSSTPTKASSSPLVFKAINTSAISAAWSPKILGHKQFEQQQQQQLNRTISFSSPPTTPITTQQTTETDSPTLSSAWSPKILGHQQNIYGHQQNHHTQNRTLPITPPNANQLMSYLDYLDDIHEHGNPINNLSSYE